MVEWSITAVLKTVELKGSGGSNPSLSAKEKENQRRARSKADFLFLLQRPAAGGAGMWAAGPNPGERGTLGFIQFCNLSTRKKRQSQNGITAC